MRQIGAAAEAGKPRAQQKKGLTVQINGGQFTSVIENVKSYELRDMKAAVYHVLVLSDGSTLYVNDFGIRSVHVRDEGSNTTSPF